MNKNFENLAARAAPAIFVVLWSTGFIGTKYVLRDAEPLTYLAIRMALVVGLMAIIARSRGRDGRIGPASATASSPASWCMDFIWAAPRSRSPIRFPPGSRR